MGVRNRNAIITQRFHAAPDQPSRDLFWYTDCYVYVVVDFLSQVIFIFLLFQLHLHTMPYPKAKKISWDEKLTATYPPTWSLCLLLLFFLFLCLILLRICCFIFRISTNLKSRWFPKASACCIRSLCLLLRWRKD